MTYPEKTASWSQPRSHRLTTSTENVSPALPYLIPNYNLVQIDPISGNSTDVGKGTSEVQISKFDMCYAKNQPQRFEIANYIRIFMVRINNLTGLSRTNTLEKLPRYFDCLAIAV